MAHGSTSEAGTAYLVEPDGGPGPGVLVLHSWWGLTAGVKAVVESLADAGFTALAPTLLPGPGATDVAEAARSLAAADANATAALILSSIVALRARSVDPEAPVGVLGYSMGASWALWVATRQPRSVGAVVAYYGVTDIDFADLSAPVLGQFAESDPLVSEDEVVELHSHLLLLGHSVEVHRCTGTRHFFAESGVPVLDGRGSSGPRTDDEEAASERAFVRTVAFLAENLPRPPG